jgi:hypothetical protein
LKRSLSKTSDLSIRDKIEYSMTSMRMKMSKSREEESYPRILKIRQGIRIKCSLVKINRIIPRDSLRIWQDSPIIITLAPEPPQ